MCNEGFSRLNPIPRNIIEKDLRSLFYFPYFLGVDREGNRELGYIDPELLNSRGFNR